MENNNPNPSPDYQTILDNYAKAITAQPQPVSPPPQTPITPEESPAEASTTPTLETGFESQLESGLTSSPTPPPSKKIDFIKIIFYLSLVSFLFVCLYGVYSFLQNPNGQSFFSSPTPTVAPTSTPTPATACTLNDQQYPINTSFPAADGCNTCTCTPDLHISCTTVTCDVTPPASTSSAIPSDWKTYTDNENRFLLTHPTSFQPSSQIEIIKNPLHLTPKQYSDKLVSDSKNDELCPECYKVISEKEYVADGKTGLLQEGISHPGGSNTKFIIANNDTIIVLTHGFSDPETPILENSKQDFLKILSTFKFL